MKYKDCTNHYFISSSFRIYLLIDFSSQGVFRCNFFKVFICFLLSKPSLNFKTMAVKTLRFGATPSHNKKSLVRNCSIPYTNFNL